MSVDPTLLDDLEWRGLLAESTDRDALRAALAEGSVRYYVGFDPTAPSLHMGNLVQIVTAMRLQRAGHTPFALVGGATGMIGDPRDSGERTLNSLDTVQEWTARVRAQIEPFLSFEGDNAATMVNNFDWTAGLSVIDFLRDIGKHFPVNRMLARETVRRQIEPFLSFEGSNAATMVNNYDWTASLSTIDFLRDIGKHFPVNRMLARDVVKSRLEAGISYTEFSYVLLQSMDFLTLHRQHGITLQFGGSDQWGNLTGGVDLIRRAEGATAHAFATPLITKADGTKYGKTEGGALWLDPELMPPYAFHQFWLNVEDEKVGELLRVFTFLSREEIEDLEARHAEKPFLREAQKVLADEVTSLVHGPDETENAKAAAQALFGTGDITSLSAATLEAALGEAGSVDVDGAGIPDVVDLLVLTGLAKSKGEARRTVGEGGAYVNNVRVDDPEHVPAPDDLIASSWLVLRRGKKRFAGVRVR
ncbi:MAG TPA: tyrosine--tRNA ligase [Nocardioides sp.]|nr:tyrosine--tRNA ligase [Nocardioides sp.]